MGKEGEGERATWVETKEQVWAMVRGERKRMTRECRERERERLKPGQEGKLTLSAVLFLYPGCSRERDTEGSKEREGREGRRAREGYRLLEICIFVGHTSSAR